MVRRCLIGLVLAATPAIALAQIQWITDPQTAVSEAQASGKPLIVYVRVSSSERDQEDDVDRDHQKSFRDKRVMRSASRFVPLKLSNSRHRDVLGQFGLSKSASMEMSFVSPDGKPLGPTLSAGGIGEPESLLQRLSQAMTRYGELIYSAELRPLLVDEAAKPDAVIKALKRVAEIRVTSADRDVLAAATREGVADGVRQEALETLAALSSKLSVDKLMELARADDAAAKKVLSQCTPAGAELMSAALLDKDGKIDPLVYQAVTKICGVKQTKPSKWFESAKASAVEAEIKRVKDAVEDAASRWRAENE